MMSKPPTGQVGRILLRNTAWNYIAVGVNLFANFVTFPIVIRALGDEAAGIWLVLGSITGYMGLLRLGVVPALTRFVATQLAEGHLEDVNRRASTAMLIVLGSGSLALLAVPMSSWFASWLHLTPDVSEIAPTAFALGFVGFFLQLPGHVYNALLNGAQRQDYTSQVWIVSAAVKAVVNIALLWAGFGLLSLLWFDLLLIAVAGGLQWLMARKAIPSLRLSMTNVHWTEARELMSFGGLIVINQSCRLIIDQTDRLVIGTFLSITMVTYYSAGWKLYALAYSVPITMLAAVGPMAGAMFGGRDEAGLRALFLRSTKYSGAVAWPVLLALAGCAAVVLDAWAGKGFGEHANVVQVLLLSFALTAHNHAGGTIVMAMRRIAPLTWQYEVPQAVLNLVLSVWLVQHYGILGVAIGTAVPAIALEYFFLRHVLTQLRVGWRQFWKDAIAPAAVPALIAFTPLAAGYWAFGDHARILVPIAAACACAYLAVFWFGSLHADERRELRAHLRWPFPRPMESA
jgi:O-antigen/teichoic acid export membrane protein